MLSFDSLRLTSTVIENSKSKEKIVILYMLQNHIPVNHISLDIRHSSLSHQICKMFCNEKSSFHENFFLTTIGMMVELYTAKGNTRYMHCRFYFSLFFIVLLPAYPFSKVGQKLSTMVFISTASFNLASLGLTNSISKKYSR